MSGRLKPRNAYVAMECGECGADLCVFNGRLLCDGCGCTYDLDGEDGRWPT